MSNDKLKQIQIQQWENFLEWKKQSDKKTILVLALSWLIISIVLFVIFS